VYPSYLGKWKHHFCNRKCFSKWRKENLARINPNLYPTQELAYILGVLLGDGDVGLFYDGKSIRPRIRLKATSKEFVLSFKNTLEKIGLHPFIGFSKSKNPRWRDCYYTYAYSKVFYKWYENLSMNDIFKIIRNNKNLIVQFLRGIYESEGSLTKYDLRVICNTDFGLIRLVEELLLFLGFNFHTIIDYCNYRKGYKIVYHIGLKGGKKERDRFISLINPVFKFLPRNSHLSY
jgi:hypothetical protein